MGARFIQGDALPLRQIAYLVRYARDVAGDAA